MDYYQTLGVPRNASDSDLKKAYKKASMQHHPDRGGDEAKFKEINEAYSTLKDPNKRAITWPSLPTHLAETADTHNPHTAIIDDHRPLQRRPEPTTAGLLLAGASDVWTRWESFP